MIEEELEKEAKQSYLDNTDHIQWDAEGEFDYTRGYINAAEPREKKIEELEKENTELEKENTELKKEIDEAEIKCIKGECPRLKTLENKQLTKAKEIIKKIFIQFPWCLPPELNADAEQFLKEIEK